MPKGDDIVLGKLGGSGDLIPAALRWFRRRGTSEAEVRPNEDVVSGEVLSAPTDPSADAAALELTAPVPLPTACTLSTKGLQNGSGSIR